MKTPWAAMFIPPHPNLSNRDRIELAELAIELDEQAASAEESLLRKREACANDYLGKLTALLGEDGYFMYRESVEQVREERDRRLDPPKGPDLEAEQDRWLEDKRSGLLKSLGIEGSALEGLRQEYSDTLAKLRTVKAASVVPESEVPTAIRTRTTNPWALYTPPYPDVHGGWRSRDRGFDVSRRRTVRRNVGVTGTRVTASNFSAGNSDYAVNRQDATMVFNHRTDAGGLLHVWIEAECVRGVHSGFQRDEWGISGSESFQNNYIFIHPIHRNIDGLSLAALSWHFAWVRGGGNNWDVEYVRPGGRYWVELFSQGAAPAGAVVPIRVGTRSVIDATANDVSVLSNMDFQWVIRSVHVESTGR